MIYRYIYIRKKYDFKNEKRKEKKVSNPNLTK